MDLITPWPLFVWLLLPLLLFRRGYYSGGHYYCMVIMAVRVSAEVRGCFKDVIYFELFISCTQIVPVQRHLVSQPLHTLRGLWVSGMGIHLFDFLHARLPW